ncbi:MAG: hypothetical protein GY842_23230 [bacterium]|nr:hypothetical protein [bacterium]
MRLRVSSSFREGGAVAGTPPPPSRSTPAAGWFGRYSAWTAGPTVVGAVLLAQLAGCAAESKTEPVEQRNPSTRLSRIDVGKLADKVDLTGSREAWKAHAQMLNTARLKVEELDVEAFNQAVGDLATVVGQFQERLDALPRRGVPDAVERLTEAAGSLTSLSKTLESQTAVLDLEATNALVTEVRGAVVKLGATIETLDESIDEVVAGTQSLTTQAEARVEDFPADELRHAVSELDTAAGALGEAAAMLPTVAQQLDATLATIKTTAGVAIGVLVLLGLGVVSHLLRSGRRRAS